MNIKKFLLFIAWILFSIFVLSSYQNENWLDSYNFGYSKEQKILFLCLEKHGGSGIKVEACKNLLRSKEHEKREFIYGVLFLTSFIVIPFSYIYRKINKRKQIKLHETKTKDKE